MPRTCAVGLLSILTMLLCSGPAAIGDDGPAGPPPPTTQPAKVPVEEVTIAGRVYKLELAATQLTRTKGLMGRTEIPAGTGMIFVFPRDQVLSFWMANCLTDIDAYFLDARGRIVAKHAMKKQAPRGRFESVGSYTRRLRNYSSHRPARFVIEVPPGSLRAHQLKVGSTIEFDRERLKKLAR